MTFAIAVRRNMQREKGTVLLLREIPRKIASPTLRAAGISAAKQHFFPQKEDATLMFALCHVQRRTKQQSDVRSTVSLRIA